jgi:hypothetical protein
VSRVHQALLPAHPCAVSCHCNRAPTPHPSPLDVTSLPRRGHSCCSLFGRHPLLALLARRALAAPLAATSPLVTPPSRRAASATQIQRPPPSLAAATSATTRRPTPPRARIRRSAPSPCASAALASPLFVAPPPFVAPTPPHILRCTPCSTCFVPPAAFVSPHSGACIAPSSRCSAAHATRLRRRPPPLRAAAGGVHPHPRRAANPPSTQRPPLPRAAIPAFARHRQPPRTSAAAHTMSFPLWFDEQMVRRTTSAHHTPVDRISHHPQLRIITTPPTPAYF